ncbi:hypothetical protein V1504DRAFT_480773 [Lipomyces starkeyi]
MNFGTPDAPTNSNARYMNVSSMRITNLEEEDVYIYLQYLAPYVYGGGLPFEMQSYQFKVPKGSSKLLVDGLEKAGLTYVQLLMFNGYKGQVDLTQRGSARVVIDDFTIVVPHKKRCGHTISATPTAAGLTTSTHVHPKVPIPAHYEGFNFSPHASVVRSSGNGEYGSKRSSGPNALVGISGPYNDTDPYQEFAISLSSEQIAACTIKEFYVTIFNISSPTIAPSRSATLMITLMSLDSSGMFSGVNYASLTIPAGEEMYKVNATAVSEYFADTFAVLISATFDDYSEAGVIIDGLQFKRSHYSPLSESCRKYLRTLTFDGIDTSCGAGNVAAPVNYQGFRLHYPTSEYEEPSPWNVTAASLYAANSSESLVADGSTNILYGSTGINGTYGVYAFYLDSRDSLYLDETHSLKSAEDFDFDLVSLRLGLDEIATVSGGLFYEVHLQGLDKCGNKVANMTRYYVPFPGTGGSFSQLLPGMLAESNFEGLREVIFSVTAPVVDPVFGKPGTFFVPFWIDAVMYRRSDLDSCPT